MLSLPESKRPRSRIIIIVFVVLAFFCAGTFAIDYRYPSVFSEHFPGYRAYRIPSDTMSPSLLKDDRILVSFVAYDRHDPGRGDIVMFQMNEGGSTVLQVKRVVALGGDEVAVISNHTQLNGRLLQEPFIANDGESDSGNRFGPVKVPMGTYFLLGDDRPDSYDSRYIGAVERTRIVGKVIRRMRPDEMMKGWQPVN